MVHEDKRIRIISGHYGSGKSEFALNYAMALIKVSPKCALADLDIVNVFFRSREMLQVLESEGIKVISSTLTQNSVDLPAVSAEIVTPVKDKSYDYIVDLGGNDVGTIVLAKLLPFIDRDEVDLFMVVNVYRPDTSTVEKILEQIRSIETATGLKISGLVNNSNLIRESDYKSILVGERMLREVSELTEIPIKYTSYNRNMNFDDLELSGDRLCMELFLRKKWM